jgi:hypothetical protein
MSNQRSLGPIVDSPWTEAAEAEELRMNAEIVYLAPLIDPVMKIASSRHYIKAVKILDYFLTRYVNISASVQWVAPAFGAYTFHKPRTEWGPGDIEALAIVEFWKQTTYDRNHEKLESLLQVEKLSAEWKLEVKDLINCLHLSNDRRKRSHSILEIQRVYRQAEIQLHKVSREDIPDECPICWDPLIDSNKHLENMTQTLPTADNLARIPVSAEAPTTHELLVDCFSFHNVASFY